MYESASRSDRGRLFHTKGSATELIGSCLHCGGSPCSCRPNTTSVGINVDKMYYI